MYKILLLTILASITFPAMLSAQTSHFAQKDFALTTSHLSPNATESFLQTAVLFSPINPIFLIENKKFYVGLTKEFSIWAFPYGRLATEYSFIFRETRLNHLRVSYNFDIPVEAGDIAAFLLSFGGGYFTDFDKSGYFPQASFSLVLPANDNVAAMLYFKARNTFMTDKSKSDIFDISFGIASAFHF